MQLYVKDYDFFGVKIHPTRCWHFLLRLHFGLTYKTQSPLCLRVKSTLYLTSRGSDGGRTEGGVFRHALAAAQPKLMKNGDKEETKERRTGAEEGAWGLLTLGSPGTGAFVGIDQVNAGAPILARLGETFIDLVRAVGPHVSGHALRERRNQREEEEEGEAKEVEEKAGRGRREGKV